MLVVDFLDLDWFNDLGVMVLWVSFNSWFLYTIHILLMLWCLRRFHLSRKHCLLDGLHW